MLLGDVTGWCGAYHGDAYHCGAYHGDAYPGDVTGWCGAAYHGHAPACGLLQSSLAGSFNPSSSLTSTHQNSDWQIPEKIEKAEKVPVAQNFGTPLCNFNDS